MARIKILRQSRADLKNEGTAIVDRAVAEDREMTADERTKTDALFAKLDRVNRDIRLEEAAMDRQRLEPTVPHFGEPMPHEQAERDRMAALVGLGQRHRPTSTGVTGFGPSSAAIVESLFGGRSHDTGGFHSASEFFSSVISGRHDPRLIMAAGQGEAGGPIGGFLLTSAIEAQILRLVLDASIFAGRAQFRAMTAPVQEFPAFSTEMDGANGTYYGLQRQWLPESGTATVQTATLDMRELKAHRAAYVVKLTNQLLQDVPGFEQQLLALIAGAIGHFQDVDILNGTGAGQPRGVLTAPATIVVPKEAGQAADTIVYANVLNMWSRLAPSSAADAIWLASPSCLPQLETMTVVVGAGGSHVKALTETAGRYSLLGRELVVTHKCKPVGDQGDLALLDPSQLLVGIRAGMIVARSEHVGFLDDSTHLRVITRWDAQPTWKAAHSPGSGHPTSSPYVTLGARP